MDFIPRAANILNQRANKILITPEQIVLLQSWFREPDQRLAEVLQQHVEPLMSVLAEELLERPILKLLGESDFRQKDHQQATSNEQYLPAIDVVGAQLVLSQPGVRAQLSQLYIAAKTEESQLSAEFLRFLTLLSGGGAEPLQLNTRAFDQLETWFIQANVINPGAYTKEILLKYLTSHFAQHFFSSELMSRLLIKFGCEPTATIPDPVATAPTAPHSADINLPYAAVLSTLPQSSTLLRLAPESETLLFLPQCPAGMEISGMMNVTAGLTRGIGRGYGTAENNNTLLHVVNSGTNFLSLNLRSAGQATSFSSLFHPGNRPALTSTSAPAAPLSRLQPSTAITAESHVSAGLLSDPSPMHWLTWLDQLVSLPQRWLGVEGLPNGINFNRFGHNWYKRDVSVQRHPALVIPRANQYDLLSIENQPLTTVPALLTDARSAAKAVDHWFKVITEAPAEQIEAAFERFYALRSSKQSLREIGLDPLLRDKNDSSLSDRIKMVLQVLDKVLIPPSALDQTEFAILQNDFRSGFYEGLPILSGGELLTRMALLAEMVLPTLDSLFWQKPEDFAGFAAINTKINSQLQVSATGVPDISVHEFFTLVEQQKDLFFRQLGQQHAEISAGDIARLRALLTARLQKDYPILKLASNSSLQDKRCFDGQGIRLSLAAAVVAESQCKTIRLSSVLQIAQHLLLSQPFATLREMLGQTLYLGNAAGEDRIKSTLRQEARRLFVLLEFTRSRRALDKLLRQPQDVEPVTLSSAKEAFDEASRQFYASALLSLPQPAQEQLAQHFPQSLMIKLIEISRPGDHPAHKPCLGIIVKVGEQTYLVSPFLRISDATERDVIDITRNPAELKRALTNILFSNVNSVPDHQLTLTEKLLSYRDHHGGLWNQLMAEEIVLRIGENEAALTTTATSSVPTTSEGQALYKLWRIVDSIIGWTNYRHCEELLDDIFSPDKHYRFLELAGTGAMCLETLLPGEEEEHLLMTVGETVVGKVLTYIKQGKTGTQTDNPQDLNDEEIFKWEDREVAKFNLFATLNKVYAHAGLLPYLRRPVKPCWSSLSTAEFRPQQNSKIELDNLAGYATEITQRAEGKDYLTYKYGEEEIYYEVESESVASSGEIYYRIPAGAPSDRIVSVTRDESGNLNVVANNYIKVGKRQANHTVTDEDGSCQLVMPVNMTPGENLYVSVFNDNRLVIEVKDQDGNIYLREVNEAGEFVPWEPTLFPAMAERIKRSIDNEPSSSSSVDVYGRYGLQRISDRKRREQLIALYQHRKSLMQLTTEKELKIDIIWQANETKKEACFQALKNYLDTLPVNEAGRENYQSLIGFIDDIASGATNFINPPLDPAIKSYVDFLQRDINVRKGLANILQVFELPGSDHALTRNNIDSFKTKANFLINLASIFASKLAAFNKAKKNYSQHRGQYSNKYSRYIFKRESIIGMFLYGSGSGLTRSETVNNIKYIAMGESIEEKFPRLSRDLRMSREYGEKQIEKIHETMRLDRAFISRELGKMFHVQSGYAFNTTVFERILVALNTLLVNHSEEEIRIFKDYSKYNPSTHERKLLVLNTYLERIMLPYSGVLGQSSPSDVEVEPLVGISCTADGSFKTVLSTYLHELFHYAIPGIVREELDIEDEIYVNYTDRVKPLSQQEQAALLHKIMSSPNVFRAYIKDEPEYLRAFVHACRYSSNQEQVTLAKELRAAWREPLTQVMLGKVDKLIKIMFANPQLKLDLAVYFPDFTVAILRWLAEKARPVIHRVEAPSESSLVDNASQQE
ncbi:hypothetical protein CUN67_24620 (plasmid) [Pantoea cypripedii]|uniref:Uncharacterized protein n=2 Tax=Pantoea cypripedii TaxID=55209 RepID=A0A6B9G9X1_PANCY|nr:hypothetical protein CUN67_24620 [Pantoea cypripedii]